MTYKDFIAKYNPDFKCYAVYKESENGYIERELILDTPHMTLSNRPYINCTSYYAREVYLDQITDVIVTSIRWKTPREVR